MQCRNVHLYMWMDISGARAVFVITETQYIGGHLRHRGNIAIIAQTRGDKTISPQRGITSLSLTLKRRESSDLALFFI